MFRSNRHRQSVVHATLLGALACWSLLIPACGDGGSAGSARDGGVRIDLFGDLDRASDLVVQPDGRIVAAGLGRNGTGGGLALVRVLP